MFWDFIDKYRQQRAPEREARDRQYKDAYQRATNHGSYYGSIVGTVGGMAGTALKQGADNVGRGVSDFYSAWRDSVNPGHKKVEPMNEKDQLSKFYTNIDNTVWDIDNPDDVSFSKTFRITDDPGNKRDVIVGYKNAKNDRGIVETRIASVYDTQYSEQPFSGKDALADYFRKTYNMDSGEYTIDDYGQNSRTSRPNDAPKTRKYNIGQGFSQFNPDEMFPWWKRG